MLTILNILIRLLVTNFGARLSLGLTDAGFRGPKLSMQIGGKLTVELPGRGAYCLNSPIGQHTVGVEGEQVALCGASVSCLNPA